VQAEEFLAAMADKNEISSNTIHVYKAGLSWYYSQRSTSENPFNHIRIAKLIKGIENEKAKQEQEKRKNRPRTDPVTMDTIRLFSTHLTLTDEKHLLMLAASSLSAASACRPSELLGSTQHRDRAITIQQLEFFETETSKTPMEIPEQEEADRGTRDKQTIPNHCSITLHISKTNQLRKREVIYISSPLAVESNWRWRIHRGNNIDHGAELFRRTGFAALRMSQLLAFMVRMLTTPAHVPFFTGKAFRIGGTSSFAAMQQQVVGHVPVPVVPSAESYMNEEEMNDIGRWKSKGMWRRYADEASKKQRAIINNRRL
jgi:hypothetical protein